MREEHHERQPHPEAQRRAVQALTHPVVAANDTNTAFRLLGPADPSLPPQDIIPGHLCEQCLDAPAVQFQPAPWGGEMGVCLACAAAKPKATGTP